jgi:hypothetical protein
MCLPDVSAGMAGSTVPAPVSHSRAVAVAVVSSAVYAGGVDGLDETIRCVQTAVLEPDRVSRRVGSPRDCHADREGVREPVRPGRHQPNGVLAENLIRAGGRRGTAFAIDAHSRTLLALKPISRST